MTAPRFIDIDGKRHLWRDIVKLRQEQRRAAAQAIQPPLFELHDDVRPASERTAAGRYREPSLFSLLDQNWPQTLASRPSALSLRRRGLAPASITGASLRVVGCGNRACRAARLSYLPRDAEIGARF
jgi:hypothetical protein